MAKQKKEGVFEMEKVTYFEWLTENNAVCEEIVKLDRALRKVAWEQNKAKNTSTEWLDYLEGLGRERKTALNLQAGRLASKLHIANRKLKPEVAAAWKAEWAAQEESRKDWWMS